MLILMAWLAGCAHSPLVVHRDWKALDYPSDEARELVRVLWHELQSSSAGWQRPAPMHSGAMLEQWWCSPEVPEDDCRTGVVGKGGTRGVAWRGLAVVFGEGNRVEWITVDAGRTPVDSAGGLALTLRIDAEDLQLEDWEIVALRFADQTPTARVRLGPDLYTSIEQSSFTTPGPTLDQLLASPGSFGAAAGGAYSGLRAELTRAIAAHELRKCAYGRYHGDSSPRCELVPLTSREEQGATDQVRLEQGHYESLLRSEAQDLHRLLVEIFPPTVAP